MRNHQVVTSHPLLDQDGSLVEPGWSTSLLQVYDRSAITASKLRIKEWDYYLVLHKDFGFAFTISDDGYIGLQSVSLLDFKHGFEHTETILNAFPMGKLHMPSTSEKGDCIYQDKRLDMRFIVSEQERRITCTYKNFYQKKTLYCDITLHQPNMDSMVIAIPWSEKKTAFYYNQKINCMRASGFARLDDTEYVFDPTTDFGTLDWGRGVWTFDNTWYWGNGNAIINGIDFGFNVGYGFGDTSAATENLFIHDGKAHKIEDVTFHIPKDSYMKQWHITSSDHRLKATFTPILDRAAKTSALIIVTDQHQVFGYLDGYAILDDGTRLSLEHILCFFEKVHNRY